MAEIGISVASKVAEYAVVPVLGPAVKRHAQFLFCSTKIKRNLESMKEKLRSKQESVMKQKEDARNRNEITVEAVENWLNKVSEMMREMGQLEGLMQQQGSSCCWGWCSTLKGYRLCKQMAELTESMQHLNDQHGEFHQFFIPAPIPDIEFFSSENFVCSESTKLASKQLLEALGDDSVYVIGLHGMGGCGKTTLAKEVGKKTKELRLFDHVLFTTISQHVNVKKIQDEIVGLLSFKFESEIEAVRARALSSRLQNGEKHLIILDDVWSSFDLEEGIGIPLHNKCKGCKVLLTTCLLTVCGLMNCEKKIQLNLLSFEEAWNLFQKNTHVVDESKSVARDIVEECKGLPIAIVAVARSLKDRSLDTWKAALHNLKTAKPIDVEEGERDAYSCLKLSYDYLRKVEAKLLLKICSMFPEDHRIPLEELFRYGIGLGICEEIESFEVTRSIVNAAIDDLVCSSLLFYEHNVRGQKFLKIHDLIRDVILWISSKEDNTIMIDPKRDLNSESMKGCYAISLWYKEIDQFPQDLVAPELQILLLKAKNNVDFSHASFEGIQKLKVISLSYSYFSITSSLSLTFATQRFDNLCTLRLKKLEIGDISFVVNLRKLKILGLEGSSFKNLPNGIENINELKLMDLTDCKIEEACHEVIGRCSKLSELYVCGGSVVLPFKCFLYNTFPKLQRYHLKGGNSSNSRRFGGEHRAVRFEDLNISNSGVTIKDLLQRANTVCLDKLVGGCKSIIPEFVEAAGKMDELTQLHLRSCSEIECIIDTTTFDHAESFQEGAMSLFPLSVVQSLKQLKVLIVIDCDKLEYITWEFNQTIQQRQPSSNTESSILEANASKLWDEVSTHYLGKLERLDLRNLPSLSSICMGPSQSLRLQYLQSLTIHRCGELKSLFPIAIHYNFPELTMLEISYCKELEEIMTEDEESLNLSYTEPCFPKLQVLRVTTCDKLKWLFSVSIAPQLEQLCISRARRLKQAFTYKMKDVSCNTEKILLPNLRKLRLEFLPNFVSICIGLKVVKLQLIELMVNECPKFDSVYVQCSTEGYRLNGCNNIDICDNLNIAIIKDLLQRESSVGLAGSYSKLHKAPGLLLFGCSKIESIIDITTSDHAESFQIGAESPKLVKLKIEGMGNLKEIIRGPPSLFCIFEQLEYLCIKSCDKLMSLFPLSVAQSLMQLKDLNVSYCRELKHIILNEENNGTEAVKKEIFPNLKHISFETCDELECVFPISVADTLLLLEEIEIRGCKQLKSIIRNEEPLNPSNTQQCFPNLRTLTLIRLPNFVDNCLRVHVMNLQHMHVDECPKFDSIYFHWSIERASDMVANASQLNNGVSAHHVGKLETLCLSDLPCLSFKWIGPPRSLSLQYLKYIDIRGCGQLKSIFSTAIRNSFLELIKLEIFDCEELEEIMIENEETQFQSNTQPCFPKLKVLRVRQCNKLKSLFSVSIAAQLLQLEELHMSEATELEQAFRNKYEDVSCNIEKIILPNLRNLTLVELPNFVDICLGLKVHAMKLQDMIVDKCPKFDSNSPLEHRLK